MHGSTNLLRLNVRALFGEGFPRTRAGWRAVRMNLHAGYHQTNFANAAMRGW